MNPDHIAKLIDIAWIPSEQHGPGHCARVARFGTLLADLLGLGEDARQCIDLFAWTHDLARRNDGPDPGHAQRGTEYLDKVINTLELDLDADGVALVRQAIAHHNAGITVQQACRLGLLEGLNWPNKKELLLIVGACWDADRLDLLRLGREPDQYRMSTPYWEDVLVVARRRHRVPEQPFLTYSSVG